MELPRVQDGAVVCSRGSCLLAGESSDKQLTIAPIDFAAKTTGEARVVIEPLEGHPYDDVTFLPHSHGHLIAARRAWGNAVALVVVGRDGTPLVPVEQVEDVGGHHLAQVHANLYASAWIEPPGSYKPHELPNPDGEPLTTLPDYENLWFVTFEIE
jgi:hypothetical protein